MNHWAFVAAAYGVTLFGATLLAFLSWRAMVSAEAAADALRKRP